MKTIGALDVKLVVSRVTDSTKAEAFGAHVIAANNEIADDVFDAVLGNGVCGVNRVKRLLTSASAHDARLVNNVTIDDLTYVHVVTQQT